ncbi:hypothetical protein, partial [Acinetobacter schindleri]|uniref:hypothetical protein n=1 Tax=Acinetobacter schindleri TaxID=108981 RepID=UPI002810EC98
MANDLIQINTLAWKELELATITPESGFRYINLCSVDKEDTPQARMVVLRHVNQFSVHDKFHRTLILSGFCLLKIAKISL